MLSYYVRGLISFGLRRIAELDVVRRIMYECTLGLRVGRKFLSMAYMRAPMWEKVPSLYYLFSSKGFGGWREESVVDYKNFKHTNKSIHP
jgi:hypothetical protein